VNTAAAGYSGTTPGNTSYATGITDDGGIALVDNHGVIVDQVGLSAGSLYKEGATLAPLAASSTDRSYERRPGGAAVTLQDTDDNATDFQPIAPSSPQSVVLVASPASIEFGSVAQLTTQSQSVAVKNLLLTSVTLDTPTIGGTDASDFTSAAPGVTTLASGVSATVAVTFQPLIPGAKAASLTITSTAGGTVTVPLGGVASPDTTSPVLTLPADITVEAGGARTTVSYTATAIDPVDGPIAPVCSPPSGSTFLVGTTTVSCTATDPHGNSASESFTVTVTDLTPPTLTVPSNITTEATSAATPVTFASTASDLVDGSIVSVCTPASGFGFPVATIPVNCTATDAHGNNASRSFSVTVTDHTAPALTVPAHIKAAATTPSGATVAFTASASDLVDGTRPVVCAPASGGTFAIGDTMVNCTVSDSHGNSASRSFVITVETAEVPGRMIGDFEIEIGKVTHDVDFHAQERIHGAEAGALRYTIRTSRPGRDLVDRFESTLVTEVSFFNVPGVSPGRRPASGIDTVSFTGIGRWNDHPGYTFSAVATDAGEPGRRRDSFAITVKDAGGHVVATLNATITDGNIQSLRALR
jgi:hypothetical protein